MTSNVIHPAVWAATCDELDAAGWGNYERAAIPADWRTRRPNGQPIRETPAFGRPIGSGIGRKRVSNRERLDRLYAEMRERMARR